LAKDQQASGLDMSGTCRDSAEARELELIRLVRDAGWLSQERARAYCLVLAIVAPATLIAWIAASRAGVDPLGKPLGTDFVSFWTASKLALQAHPASAYNFAVHDAAQRALFPRSTLGYAPFFYPPIFLLVCLPLAVFPYFLSLTIWLTATGVAYWRALRGFIGGSLSSVAILSFPAVLTNLGHGQNGFLTTSLFGFGILALDQRPWLAGACFGLLAYKPHLALAVPVALLAARRWETLFAAILTAVSITVLSVAIFGLGAWSAFFGRVPLARAALEQGWVGHEKMQSVFAAVRLLHGSCELAYAGQASASIIVLALLVAAQIRRPRHPAEGPLMVAATLITTPFLLDYDLALLAIPLAWATNAGSRTGFLAWEKTVLVSGYVLPLLSRTVAGALNIPLTPLITCAVFAILLRRSGIFETQDAA
jgi:hypothetical protein